MIQIRTDELVKKGKDANAKKRKKRTGNGTVTPIRKLDHFQSIPRDETTKSINLVCFYGGGGSMNPWTCDRWKCDIDFHPMRFGLRVRVDGFVSACEVDHTFAFLEKSVFLKNKEKRIEKKE
jgi:hypothetical protein